MPAASSSRMSLEQAKKLVKDLAEYEASNGREKASIIWHGGEPLLAGMEFYESIFSYQKTLGVSFSNSFQTNGSLITQEWCDCFKRNGCNVGISLDGPPEIHDQQRRSRIGEGTADQVLRGLDLCRKNDVSFGGVLCVVTDYSSSHSRVILDYFHSLGLKTYDFLPAHNFGPGPFGGPERYVVSSARFSQFMKEVFDWYLEKDDPAIEIRTITNILSQLFGGNSYLCNMQGDQCGVFLTIYPDGKAIFCCDYRSKILDEVGDLANDSVNSIMHGDRYEAVRRATLVRLDKCKDCEVLAICHGGCPRDWDSERSHWCEYYKDFYYYCYEKTGRLLREAAKGSFSPGPSLRHVNMRPT